MKYDNDIKLQQAFKIILKEFENYKNNLINKSILVIYRNRETSNLDYIIIEFTGNNYYHLTGLIYKEDKGVTSNSIYIYKRYAGYSTL